VYVGRINTSKGVYGLRMLANGVVVCMLYLVYVEMLSRGEMNILRVNMMLSHRISYTSADMSVL
jgi:hypothetical protein